MLFEKIISDGLAHNSYLIGDGDEAVVIDPRRDIEVYLKKIKEAEMRIKYVLETHRNEDYVIGSKELKEKTEAEIYHADKQLDYKYGKEVSDEDTFEFGDLKLESIHTPGHTPGSMSYLLKDYSDSNWIVFSGDALFAGDVGRTDLLGKEKLRENTELLYDSIFNKLLDLGDEVILCPAHGAGSVCAEAIEDREWTTIGIEKERNELLNKEKEEFVNEVSQMLERPPYFSMMEKMNLDPPVLKTLPEPTALSPKQFEDRVRNNWLLDTRREVSYGGAHISDSVNIWKEGIPSFAGWFLDYKQPISLVVNSSSDLDDITKYLVRIGFDEIDSYLAGGMVQWHMAGKKSESIETITVQELCKQIDEGKEINILDVRGEEEIKEKGEIEDSTKIHLTQLRENIDQVRQLDNIHVFCGSGLRSMVATSLLKNAGIREIKVILGGLAGWQSNKCKIKN